jgi:pimeloyl-ACP methyl ester carboxylesterase|tara:strand:- start:551 stop:1372 length:822 start_codon:yes stop_codon:yes gene_type:complete
LSVNFYRSQDFTPQGTFFESTGTGPETLVLCHGVGLDHTMWNAQVEALAPHLRVVSYDMIGHGRTPPDPKVTCLADFVGQLEELLDHLGIGQLMLVGFSMGGLVAQGFAKEAAYRLERLVLMNTVYRRSEAELEGVRSRLAVTREQGLSTVADLALERWFDPAFRRANSSIVDQIRDRLLSNDLDAYTTAYRVFVNGDEEVGAALKKVHCPALVMTGSLDVGSTIEIAQRMGKDLRHGSVFVLPGLRHMAPVEDPGAVNQQLLSFFGLTSAGC